MLAPCGLCVRPVQRPLIAAGFEQWGLEGEVLTCPCSAQVRECYELLEGLMGLPSRSYTFAMVGGCRSRMQWVSLSFSSSLMHRDEGHMELLQ